MKSTFLSRITPNRRDTIWWTPYILLMILGFATGWGFVGGTLGSVGVALMWAAIIILEKRSPAFRRWIYAGADPVAYREEYGEDLPGWETDRHEPG